MTMLKSRKAKRLAIKPLAAALLGLSAMFALSGCGGGHHDETSASAGGDNGSGGDNGNGGGDGPGAQKVAVYAAITGLEGSGLKLLLNNKPFGFENDDGSYSYQGELKKGDHYEVTVETYPNGQACTVSDGVGTAGNDVTAKVDCQGWNVMNSVVDTLAGSDVPGSTEETGGAARFTSPTGSMAIDKNGNTYVADTMNHVIRIITPAGKMTTFAGDGTSGASNGDLATARFNEPSGLAMGPDETLYVADTGNCAIRKISNGQVELVIGTPGDPTKCVRGTDTFEQLMSIAIHPDTHEIYVGDAFNVRKVKEDGNGGLEIEPFAGAIADNANGDTDANGEAAKFGKDIGGLAFGSDGTLYVADTLNSTIRAISANADVTTFMGQSGQNADSKDGDLKTATFDAPVGITVDSDDNVYVTEVGGRVIRRVSHSQVASTIAGNVGQSGVVEGDGNVAKFARPSGILVDANQNLRVVNDHGIRKIGRKVAM